MALVPAGIEGVIVHAIQALGRCARGFAVVVVMAAITACGGSGSVAVDQRATAAASTDALKKAQAAYAGQPDLVIAQAEVSRERIASRDGGGEAIRSRGVALNLAALPRMDASAKEGAPGTGPVLRVTFFDDASFPVRIDRIEATASGGRSYTGTVPGVPGSTVVIIDNGGVVSLSLTAPGVAYSIHGSADAGYVARQRAVIERPDHPSEPLEIHAPPASKSSSANEAQAEAVEIARDDGNVIDVMVVYTPAARNRNGGTAQMQANIDAQVALTNTIYANSGVVQRIRLVYKGEVQYTESGSMDTDLRRLTSTSDGSLDEVPILRDRYQADLVSLWGVYSDFCGLGWLMATESSGFQSNGYNVVSSPDCTAGNYPTFAHELGHNMGLRHDAFVDATPTTVVTPEAGGASTTITYAHGYVDTVNRFRTIMSYPDQCASLGYDCPRIPYFSNPLIQYDNATAYPLAVPAPLGTPAGSNERQALNDTRETVANFRQSAYSGVVMVVAGTSFSEAAGTGSITVSREGATAGAVSVAYRTLDGSARDGEDYVGASGVLSWADGEGGAKTVRVAIVDDSLPEGPESFTLRLETPTGGVKFLGATGLSNTGLSTSIQIVDNDPDNFPLGCTMPAGWTTPSGASAGWSVATDSVGIGPCSLKSNPIPDAGKSQLQLVGDFGAGNLSFSRRVSSESGFDCLRLYVDGVQRSLGGNCSNGGLSGDVPWDTVSVPLTAGRHTIVWSYEKDVAVASGSDAAWIDNVTFPTATPSAPGIVSVVRGASPGVVSVSFTAPTSVGNSPIVRYTASCGAAGQVTRSTDGPGSPLTVSGLTGGISYRCSVAATNGQGLGASSAAVAVVALATPRADFNGDGRSDILGQNALNGQRAVWHLDGSTVLGRTALPTLPVEWEFAGIGDFNGDGRSDILFQNRVSGERLVWFMNGTNFAGAASIGVVSPDWQIAAVDDFNGDGRPDLLFQNVRSGDRIVWFLNGTTFAGSARIATLGIEWRIAASGDFNADGKTDLVLENQQTGERVLWFLDGTTLTGGVSLGRVSTDWQIATTGDFNLDGRSDLVFQNVNSGVRLVWYLDGGVYIGGAVLGTVPPEWSLK
jgi:hypothetical protein